MGNNRSSNPLESLYFADREKLWEAKLLGIMRICKKNIDKLFWGNSRDYQSTKANKINNK